MADEFHSLSPGICDGDFKCLIFKIHLGIWFPCGVENGLFQENWIEITYIKPQQTTNHVENK